MVSLCVFGLLLVAAVAAEVWAMAAAARWVASPRGRAGPAAAVTAALVAINLGFLTTRGLMPRWVPPAEADDVLPAVVDGALGLLQLAVSYAVVRRGFRLSAGRAFAPFGAMIGANVALLVVAVFVVRPFAAEAFRMPTGSMSPTLNAGARFAAAKIVRRPARWDLVAYHADHGQVFCKRLLALPNETLAFDGQGGVTIDGRPVAVPPVLAGRCRAALPTGQPRYADGEPIRLAAGQYFFIGDNVDRSWDSRNMGPTNAADLIGVVDLIYWPPAEARIVR